jgi:hypothetical protein
LDLIRLVNPFVFVNKTKYEDIKTVLKYVKKGGWAYYTFDLSSGYHHINIFEPHQTFLGFCWDGQF